MARQVGVSTSFVQWPHFGPLQALPSNLHPAPSCPGLLAAHQRLLSTCIFSMQV